jgi:hypothetical protein
VLGAVASVDKDEKSAGRATRNGSVSSTSTNLDEVLTADYFPFVAGTTRISDIQMILDGPSAIIRDRINYLANGTIESITIKLGRLGPGSSLINGDKPKWLDVPLPPKEKYPHHYRQREGYIEIGSHLSGNATVYWEPVIKIGAKPGDSWTWTPIQGTTKEYTFLKFGTHKGRPSATISSLTPSGSSKMIVSATYVKGIGEVERTAGQME